jgi:hypothetical protein
VSAVTVSGTLRMWIRKVMRSIAVAYYGFCIAILVTFILISIFIFCRPKRHRPS